LSYKNTKNREKRAHGTADGTMGEEKWVFIPALELVDVNVIIDSSYVIEEYPGVREVLSEKIVDSQTESFL
jgi:hypothetical protein